MNHFYLLGSIFVESQHLPSSWGSNFVGNNEVCDNFNKYQSNACIYIFGDVNSWAKVTHERHKDWPLTNSDDSTSLKMAMTTQLS